MNALPRQTLARIVARHGRKIYDSPRRLEALLRDLCGAHRREINVLVGALEERVAADLMRSGNSVPREVVLAQLVKRLRDNLAYTPEAARWAVDSWAVALGVLSEAELAAREQEEAARARDAQQQQSSAPRSEGPFASTPGSTAPQTAPSKPLRQTPTPPIVRAPALPPPPAPAPIVKKSLARRRQQRNRKSICRQEQQPTLRRPARARSAAPRWSCAGVCYCAVVRGADRRRNLRCAGGGHAAARRTVAAGHQWAAHQISPKAWRGVESDLLWTLPLTFCFLAFPLPVAGVSLRLFSRNFGNDTRPNSFEEDMRL
ncbi:MAG: hypothetical protein WKF30_08280 [Pyrinomonadaceae bacterium]